MKRFIFVSFVILSLINISWQEPIPEGEKVRQALSNAIEKK